LVNPLLRFKGRHIVLAVAIVLVAAYYALREVPGVAVFATQNIAHPWHRVSGTVFGIVPFSVAEWLIVFTILGALAYLTYTVVKLIQKPRRLQRVYALLVAFLAGALTIYAMICWLWGITYYSYTYTELSGIETQAVSVQELKEVTIYFAEVATAASQKVERDQNGLYVCDIQQTVSDAPALYANLPEQFNFLQGPEVPPKPMFFSYIMSHLNYTGVFFPLTGEANFNEHSPDCFIPATVTHEISHQRGVTREQDANFTSVLVCMESDDPNFIYSGALLAYTHLANALYLASYEAWAEAQSYIGDYARKDLIANHMYWQDFKTTASEISEAAYDGYLQNQGQELGTRSYGACVDLLVAYYGEAAK